MTIAELKEKNITELTKIARTLDLPGAEKLAQQPGLTNKYLTSPFSADTLASSRDIRKLLGFFSNRLQPASNVQKFEHLRGPVTHLFKVSFTLDSFTTY